MGVTMALVAAGLAPAAGTPEPAHDGPWLRLVRVQPLTVAGKGFKPREHVRVTAVRGEQSVFRVLTASRAGGFVVTFAELRFRRCGALSVRAYGARGSRAILKVAQPACATG